MEKINIAEILKTCPKGMELDCIKFDGIVTFEGVTDCDYYPIKISIKYGNETFSQTLTRYGQTCRTTYDKCVVFPKGKTTWEGFQRPFKDGDILFIKSAYNWILIYKDSKNKEDIYKYAAIPIHSNNTFITNDDTPLCYKRDISNIRFATEEEKQKLFEVIKANGYKWNAKTKTLEKLHQFKPGDVLVSETGNIVLCSHIDDKQIIHYHCILYPIGGLNICNAIGVGKESNCTLANNWQKQKLFDKLKSSGYSYNPETNKLEKLIIPKFKVGDSITNGKVTVKIDYIDDEYYYMTGRNIASRIYINTQDNWQLDKFDITTLKPFDKVLVRCSSLEIWHIQFFEHYNKQHSVEYPFVCMCGNKYNQCIPYENNKHLLNTANNCEEYYKTW